jgi:hypothetical protein
LSENITIKKADTMETIAETSYKTDEKKAFTPEEFTKAKTVCDFVIDLTKAISRSGYYDANHPVSNEVKKGLYDAFKNALGNSAEIMLTCHDYEDQVDIHISGILDEPFNIRKLTHANTSDLFVPKLKDYFERKSLNSFVIKKYIKPEHFESFIDVMSEPIAESADATKLGEYLTKALADLDITEVSAVFKTDVVLLRGKLPWRVSIILRRLAKDLKVVPMFRSASADKMKLIKQQIVEDIIRPLNNKDLLRDLIINCDVITTHIKDMMEADELEKLIISSLPKDSIMPILQAVFEVYKLNKKEIPDSDAKSKQQQKEREAYLSKVLNIAAHRILSENVPDSSAFLEQLYEYEIIGVDMLPKEIRFNIQSKQLAGDVISQIDTYIEKALKTSSVEEMESLVVTFKRVLPVLIRQGEWPAIDQIMKAVSGFSSREEFSNNAIELFSQLPDSVFEGSEEMIADQYIHAEPDLRNKINDLLMQLKSVCIKIADIIFNECKDPGVLKNITTIMSKKGELARQWVIKTLGGNHQTISTINIALLLIINVGRSDDADLVKQYVKNSNSSIRAKALGAMAKLNKKEIEGVVTEALIDEEEKVRSLAASIIENEISLSGESINKLLVLVKERLTKKDIKLNEAVFIAGLIKVMGKSNDGVNKESLESEIVSIASDLQKEKKGLMKFIKTEISRENMEILCACASVLGKIGGAKSGEYLKNLSRGDTALSKAANEALVALNKH